MQIDTELFDISRSTAFKAIKAVIAHHDFEAYNAHLSDVEMEQLRKAKEPADLYIDSPYFHPFSAAGSGYYGQYKLGKKSGLTEAEHDAVYNKKIHHLAALIRLTE